MDKILIGNDACVCPMPMSVIGSVADGKNNFMTAAWVSRVNFDPPMMGVAIGKGHLTARAILEHKEFSINIPSVDLMAAVDYVGMVSGNQKDKSTVFKTFKGTLEYAPMVSACPLCMECRLSTTVDFPKDIFVIGEIVGVYTEDRFMTDGMLDSQKINPFTLTMPDNGYWTLGQRIGRAWDAGKAFKEETTI